MKCFIKGLITVLLFSSIISIVFFDIKENEEVQLDLDSTTEFKYYTLTCLIADETDTIIRFLESEIDPIDIKIYIYDSEDIAEIDHDAYFQAIWTNELKGQELISHMKLNEGKAIEKIYIGFICIICSKSEENYSNSFKITNELVEEIILSSGVIHKQNNIYSKKEFRFIMPKKLNMDIRFIYTPISEQTLTIKTYNGYNGPLVSTEIVNKPIQFTRTDDTKDIVDYYVIVTVEGDSEKYQLVILYEEYIQAIEIKDNNKIVLEFSKDLHLYFYVKLSDYTFNDENSLTLSIKNEEGKESISPIIYAKDAFTDLSESDFDKLIPQTPDDNLFPMYSHENKENHIIYFKKTDRNSNYLFINIGYIDERVVTLVLSPKAQMIDSPLALQLHTYQITLEENVPIRYVISTMISQHNMLIYFPQENLHRTFEGTILKNDLTINPLEFKGIQLYGIDSSQINLITYEFFGKAGKYTFSIEPISSPIFYFYKGRSNSNAIFKELETIGQTYYFIEYSNTNIVETFILPDERYGKFEYLFKDTITLSPETSSLLPNNQDKSTGYHKLTSLFFIFGVKVISPGEISFSIKPNTSENFTLDKYIQYDLFFTKGKKYTLEIDLEEFDIQIMPLKFENNVDEIKLSIKETTLTYTIKSDTSPIISGNMAPFVIESCDANGSVAFRLINNKNPLTKIGLDTKVITEEKVLFKFDDENIMKYQIKFGKNIQFNYDIRTFNEDFIPLPNNLIAVKEEQEWLSLNNPLNKYGKIENGWYYYLTMSFNKDSLPIPITITSVKLPEYPKMSSNDITQFTTGKRAILKQSKIYNNKEDTSLFIISSACTCGNDQKIILSHELHTELQVTKLTPGYSFIEYPNLHLPLYLEFIDNDRTPEGFTSLLSYEYLTQTETEDIKKILTTKYTISSNTTSIITWSKPTETINSYDVYIIKDAKNTSVMDNECYLKTLTANTTNVLSFKIDSEENFQGKYTIGLIAHNKYHNKIPFDIIYTPIIIDSDIKDKSLLWLWITLGIAVIAIIGLIFGILIKNKVKKGNRRSAHETLIPNEDV